MTNEQFVESKLNEVLPKLRQKVAEKPGMIISETYDNSGTHICFMTQNKAKMSKWAQLARSGHEIIQVIITKENGISAWRYFGVVVDSKFQTYRSYNAQSKLKV